MVSSTQERRRRWELAALSVVIVAGCDASPAGPAADAMAPGDAAATDAPGTDAAGDPGPPPDPDVACTGAASRVVRVGTADELTAALAAALPGDRIELASGVYPDRFTASASGTRARPIALCGARDAVLQGDSVSSGNGFHLTGSFWVLSGFSVTRSAKGVVLDGANANVMAGLAVFETGDEAIHLRAFSSDNQVVGCEVHDTGKRKPEFGEAVYLGSAKSNWDTYSGGAPDRSDRNQVIGNHLGPNVTTEGVDIKEGTEGGVVRGNTFDGHGMTGDNFGDSWIDVKGNGYTIEDNRGDAPLLDGFQTHVVVDGWGNGTSFRHNEMTGVPGYGIRVDAKSTGTVVACDNVVNSDALGLTNVTCQ